MIALALLLAAGSPGGASLLQPEAAEAARLLGLEGSLETLRAGGGARIASMKQGLLALLESAQ